MAEDGKGGRKTGDASRTGSRSYKRFALIIGIAAAVAIISIFAATFFVTQEGELLPPAIIVQPVNLTEGSSAFVQGSGFAPGDEVRILFNGEMTTETAPEVVIVDNFGGFNAEIVIPSEGDLTTVEATDESGNTASTTIRRMDG